MFEAIREARHHVHLEYYIFEPDRIGTALRDPLVEGRAGVVVRLLVDALGSKRLGRRFMAPLRAAGVQVGLFHDARICRRLRPVSNFRTHRKIVVCDGTIGFTGGVNITDEEDLRTRRDAYRDIHLRIEGSAVRWLQTTFLEDWTYATGESPHDTNRSLTRLLPRLRRRRSGRDPGADPRQRAGRRAGGHPPHAFCGHSCVLPAGVADHALLCAGRARADGAHQRCAARVDVRLLVPRRSDCLIVSAAARSYYDELMPPA